MKLHDLRPAPGARRERTRVGRGIAAGKGKTAGRGTKGQLARHDALPPFFEGGQTPLHIRIPKLRGFRNRFKTEYEVVNLGRISQAVDEGRLEAEAGGHEAGKGPITINQEILRAVGLVRRLDVPMKILGHGDVTIPLFVVADAFSKSAAAKIEAAGGTAQVLEVPSGPLGALAVDLPEAGEAPRSSNAGPAPSAPKRSTTRSTARTAGSKPVTDAAQPAATGEPAETAESAGAGEGA